MSCRTFGLTTLWFVIVLPAFADPSMSVVPQGIQSGNWVWEIDITPDLAQAGGSTPLTVELGFRLTGDPLVSVTNLSPLIFDANNPGRVIFGWETLYSHANDHPVGIEVNCTGCTATNAATLGSNPTTVVPGTNNEIFSAMGSVNIVTPGAKPFLKIIAQGPGTGGPLISAIQWLGAYGGKGQITQIVKSGMNFNTLNFDIFAGTATQSVPEPASGVLLAFGAVADCGLARRRKRCSLLRPFRKP